MENKFQRVEVDDPSRCQAIYRSGQCPYKVTPNSQYCHMHGGTSQEKAEERSSLRNYRLGIWQSRVGQFADHDKVKSLREEIGILRVIMEETLGMCKDSHELLIYSPKIVDTVMKIDAVVRSCHKLEQSTGMLLDKPAALRLAMDMVQIIGKHIKDDDAIDAIANELMQAVVNLGSESEQRLQKLTNDS